MPGEWSTRPVRGSIAPNTMKGQVLSSGALPEWVLISFAERQEGHPKEGLGQKCKWGQKILTPGYRAHGPAKAKQFCSVVYFSLVSCPD